MAQSVARILGKDEVTGSNPVSSSMTLVRSLAGVLRFMAQSLFALR